MKFGENRKSKFVGRKFIVKQNYFEVLQSLNWHKGVSKDYAGQEGVCEFVFRGSKPDHIALRMPDNEQIVFPFNALRDSQ